MRLSRLLCVLVLSSCDKRVPEWAHFPSARNVGEPTIAGEPLLVPRLTTPLAIDGLLNDAEWQTAVTLGPLVDPGSGADADKSPVAAFAKLAWDDRALYVGVVVRDRSPTSPFARTDVDPHVWGKASGIELMLQPGDPGDNRDYYELQVDVNGAVWDTRFDDYNQPITGSGADKRFGHQEWQSQVERASFIAKGDFYAIELAIPWAAFEHARVAIPPRANDVWRLNLYTFRDGQRFALAWSPLRGQGNFHRASRFGRIRFH
jgi:hypothetical protein